MSKRYSEKEKMRLVSGCAESGESRASYAKRQGVSIGSLSRWEAELGSAGPDKAGMRFVEVEVPAEPAGGRHKPEDAGLLVAELVLPGGARVRFFSREGVC
jgi:transposase-like protein